MNPSERGITHLTRESFAEGYLDKNKRVSERLGEKYPIYKGLVIDLVRYIDTPRTQETYLEMVESRQRAKKAGLSKVEISRAEMQAVLLYPHWIDAKYEEQMKEWEGRVVVKGGIDAVSYLGDGSGRNQLGYIQSQPSDNRE